jgi:hypothetical protein
MGGRRYPVHMRYSAVKALWWAHGNHSQAAELFKEWEPDAAARPADPNLRSFMEYWSVCLLSRYRLDITPPPGQQPRMSDEEAEQCIQLLLGGYTFRGRKYYYTSVNDALKRNSELKQLADKHGYSNSTLLKRLKKKDPSLCRRTLRFVKALSKAQRQARIDYCLPLLLRGHGALQRYLSRVIWIDSKKLYVCPEEYLVYAPKDAQLLVTDKRLPNTIYDIKKINYYSAANAVLGAVHFKICTGTTGYRELTKLNPAVLKLYTVGAASKAAS